MDRKPKAAPFKVGTRLRYRGESRVYADAEMRTPLLVPDMEVVITETRAGRQGTMIVLDEDEETGEPILDRTKDGWSVYWDARGQGRIARDNGEWERI